MTGSGASSVRARLRRAMSRDERGAAKIELIGVIVVAALIVGAVIVVAPQIGEDTAGGIECTVSKIGEAAEVDLGSAECPEASDRPSSGDRIGVDALAGGSGEHIDSPMDDHVVRARIFEGEGEGESDGDSRSYFGDDYASSLQDRIDRITREAFGEARDMDPYANDEKVPPKKLIPVRAYDSDSEECRDWVGLYESSGTLDYAAIDCRVYAESWECRQLRPDDAEPNWHMREGGERDAWERCVKDAYDVERTGVGNDEECKAAPPVASNLDGQEGMVAIGCRWYWVPKTCQSEWEDYQETPSNQAVLKKDRLHKVAACTEGALQKLEHDCVVWRQIEEETTTTSFLIYRTSETSAIVVEELGDGTYRVMVVHSSKKGFGLRFGLSVGEKGFGAGMDVGNWSFEGGERASMYRFNSMEDAEEWVNWYVEYEENDRALADLDEVWNCYGQKGCDRNGYYYGKDKQDYEEKKKEWDKRIDRHEELLREEPDHYLFEHSESNVKSKEGFVDLQGNYTVGGVSGQANAVAEWKVEERRGSSKRSNGDTTNFVELSGEGAFYAGLRLLGVGSKDIASVKGMVGGLGGFVKSSSVRVRAVYDSEGNLKEYSVTLNDSFMEVVRSLTVVGFDLKGVGLHQEVVRDRSTKGKITQETLVVSPEMLDDEQRKRLENHVDSLLPRDEDGELVYPTDVFCFEKDTKCQENAPGSIRPQMLDSIDHEGNPYFDEIMSQGGAVRAIEYDTDYEKTHVESRLTAGPIELASESWTKVERTDDMTSSVFEYTDVNGNKRTVSPAPKCDAPERTIDYDETGTRSYPATGKHRGGPGDHYDPEESATRPNRD